MAKNSVENIMTFKQKIDKILSIRKIKLWKLAAESGLNSTLEKAYEDDREMKAKTTERFLQNLGITEEWWKTGKGEIFEAQETSEDVIPVPMRVWNRLERNFNNFEKNSEMFGRVLEKEDREKADLSKKNDELVAIIKSMIGGQIQPHKMQ